MSDTLKVGETTRDPLALKPGMKVDANGDAYLLVQRCAGAAAPVLALPEEAPRDETQPREPGCQCHQEIGDSPCRVHGLNDTDAPSAAPSLESVPVGSRWRWNASAVSLGLRGGYINQPFTITGHRERKYDDGTTCLGDCRTDVLAHATRIDEPAGTGKRCETVNFGMVCEKPAGHNGDHCMVFSPQQPAMPPARCAPRLMFKRHINCALTDFNDPARDLHTGELCFTCESLNAGMTLKLDEAVAEVGKDGGLPDQREARAMRDQRWEASPSGFGGMVGGIWKRR